MLILPPNFLMRAVSGFRKISKSMGDKMEPCSTPQDSSHGTQSCLSRTTSILGSRVRSTEVFCPHLAKPFQKLLWSIVLKDAEKSRTSRATLPHLSRNKCHQPRVTKAVSVPWPPIPEARMKWIQTIGLLQPCQKLHRQHPLKHLASKKDIHH